MDYDRNDALLHWLFRQTQGDAWFRPNEENISSGVALRVNDLPEFRIFPYETPSLEPFETAVAALNPLVAIKVRSAAVHAALAEVSPEDKSIHVDAETRIQILDTILLLPHADKEQNAAFIRDERTLIIWSSTLDTIVPLCQDIEDRLIKLLWRTRSSHSHVQNSGASIGPGIDSANVSAAPSADHSSAEIGPSFAGIYSSLRNSKSLPAAGLPYPFPPFLTERGGTPTGSGYGTPTTGSRPASLRVVNGIVKGAYGEQGREFDDEDELPLTPAKEKDLLAVQSNQVPRDDLNIRIDKDGRRYKRNWYGKKAYLPSTHFEGTDPEANKPQKRPVMLYAPLYNGIAAGLAVVFVGNGVKTLLVEWKLDDTAGSGGTSYARFGLFVVVPFLWCVSLFFTLQVVQNLTMMFGPIAHYHRNSKYYSALPPPAPPPSSTGQQEPLPHITIQMPVYKESLSAVLAPSIRSIKKAMQTYARQGGTSSIFVCDDGLRILAGKERDERLAFYREEGVGWVARPRQGAGKGKADQDGKNSEGFKRRGRFKKASNLNYGLELSLKMEKQLESLLAQQQQSKETRNSTSTTSSSGSNPRPPTKNNLYGYGIQYQNRDGDESVVWGVSAMGEMSPPSPTTTGLPARVPSSGLLYGTNTPPPMPVSPSQHQHQPSVLLDPEEKALSLAIGEMYEESGRLHRPWAANGRALRIGEIILLVDSDTVVPEDCLRDAAREMMMTGSGSSSSGRLGSRTRMMSEKGVQQQQQEEEEGVWEGERVGIIQHESDVMQVAGHYFENGIAYFTRRINRCISISCANGEVAPFMGHNAFLRWKALQDAAFVDPEDGKMKIWSESNVSEDFDMALRLMLKGYVVRWATYTNGGFKEGVSLSVDDEINRWQKYSYGCNELLFNPIIQWWRKGPITKRIHTFLWSKAPLHYKISMLAYMFSYYGIAASITIALINYILLGFQFSVDGYFMHSFEIFLATTVVFWGSGTVGYTLLEYRLGHKKLISALVENLIWIPFFFFFFGGLSIPVSQAILAHLFSYNITWSATVKEVERSNFFKEIPKILKRFWFPMFFSVVIIVGMILCSTKLVPLEWRIDGSAWAVILPLSMSTACHILFPIILNPWLMVFSY